MAKIITAQGPSTNLIRIAAEQLGTPEAWWLIAADNNLTDWVLPPGIVTLVIRDLEGVDRYAVPLQ